MFWEEGWDRLLHVGRKISLQEWNRQPIENGMQDIVLPPQQFRSALMTKPRNLDAAILSTSAVTISTAATFAALMVHLRSTGIISDEDERDIYENALHMLEENGNSDEYGVFAAARELIEQHLRWEDQ